MYSRGKNISSAALKRVKVRIQRRVTRDTAKGTNREVSKSRAKITILREGDV